MRKVNSTRKGMEWSRRRRERTERKIWRGCRVRGGHIVLGRPTCSNIRLLGFSADNAGCKNRKSVKERETERQIVGAGAGGHEDWRLTKSLLEMHKAKEIGPQCLAGAPHMVTGS